MPTDLYQLPTGKTLAPATTLTPAEANALGALEDALEGVAHLVGPGVLLSTHCAPTPVAGTLNVALSLGFVVLEHDTYGYKFVPLAAQTIGPLAANRPQAAPNYIYAQHDVYPLFGSYAHNVTGTAPVNSVLVATAWTSATETVGANAMPLGRVNLISALAAKVSSGDGSAGYLADKLVAEGYVSLETVTATDGTQTLLIGTSGLDAAVAALASSDDLEDASRNFRTLLWYLVDEVGIDVPPGLEEQYEQALAENA